MIIRNATWWIPFDLIVSRQDLQECGKIPLFDEQGFPECSFS